MPRTRRSDALSKSDAQIQRETSRKWADRALVCFAKYDATGDNAWLQRAVDYEHEALEHASLVKDGGRLVGKLQREFSRSCKMK